MADEIPNTMNLDLNLGPGLVPEDETINLDEWIHDPVGRMREAVRHNNRQRWRWRPFENPMESESLMELSHFLTSVSNQGELHMGEGSVAAEEQAPDVETESKCEIKTIELDDEILGIEEDGKSSNDDGSFYNCNICFELAKDPIITCCGHLYCWPCIYRWLHIHSDTNECPVCKGEVTTKNVTPVYGRGHNRVQLEDLTLKIPPRPTAKRVESVRRSSFTNMEEMIRILGRRSDLTRDFPANQNVDNAVNPTERNPTFLLNRLMTTRAMRIEQIQAPENVVDLTESRAASPDTIGHSGIQARIIRRSATNRSPNTNTPFPPSMSASERVIEAYIRSHPIVVRRPEQSSPVDDRDSFSSIAAVMHSGGSQNIDTALEIDSVVSLSTSSSRRRNDTSRASDVDSGDSRPPRRRRLN